MLFNLCTNQPVSRVLGDEAFVLAPSSRHRVDGVNFIYALTATLSSGAGTPNFASGGNAPSYAFTKASMLLKG